ncbi:MAG: SPFH domain-containing protein [Anaerovoracaceae bacterium]
MEKKMDKVEFDGVEKKAPAISGMLMLLLNLLAMVAAGVGIVAVVLQNERTGAVNLPLLLVCGTYLLLIDWFIFAGLRVVRPNEAYVLTLFGKYYGTLRGPGFFFVNPFVSSVVPSEEEAVPAKGKKGEEATAKGAQRSRKVISLKAITLSNEKQKINDEMGNPIEIGIVVVWRVVNTAKALFNVDDYHEYLSMQCDSALRNIVRLYPYDSTENVGERSLRGSSQEVAENLKLAIQEKVGIAGIEIIEARITHLAYAQEIAAAMLQRQQAAAIIDARKMIVEGAVGMVEMALERLNDKDIVNLDEERKAAMVSNLLVVLCGNKDAQPIVNSGSIY